MRKTLAAGLLAVALTAHCASGAASSQIMSLQVRTAELHATPSALGQVVSTLNYGDRVFARQVQGSWIRAETVNGAKSGWIHSSALTRSKISIQPGDDAQAGVSTSELALAGKGFNADVEKVFRTRNPSADFSTLEKMIAIKIPSSKLVDFLREGELVGNGGSK